MSPTSFRRRLAAVAVAGAGLALAAAGGASAAPAETVGPASVAAGYWACVAIDGVDVGTCLENPLPDLSGVPTVPDTVNGLLGSLLG